VHTVAAEDSGDLEGVLLLLCTHYWESVLDGDFLTTWGCWVELHDCCRLCTAPMHSLLLMLLLLLLFLCSLCAAVRSG
jgi:hypothetical protein